MAIGRKVFSLNLMANARLYLNGLRMKAISNQLQAITVAVVTWQTYGFDPYRAGRVTFQANYIAGRLRIQ